MLSIVSWDIIWFSTNESFSRFRKCLLGVACLMYQANVDKIKCLEKYRGSCQPVFLFYQVRIPHSCVYLYFTWDNTLQVRFLYWESHDLRLVFQWGRIYSLNRFCNRQHKLIACQTRWNDAYQCVRTTHSLLDCAKKILSSYWS